MSKQVKTKKEQISEFKKKADQGNTSLYADLASFKGGLVIVLVIASIVLLYFFFR